MFGNFRTTSVCEDYMRLKQQLEWFIRIFFSSLEREKICRNYSIGIW
jgi:hypothetical protein